MEECKLWINGELVAAKSGASFENVNPATNEPLCKVHVAGPQDVEDAVTAAKRGFEVWSAMKGAERGRILFRAAQLLRERNDELAVLEVSDSGKPIQEAQVVDIISGAEAIEYYAGVAATLHGHSYDLGKGKAWAYTRREPLGICALIGAWNYPIQIACWKSAPALACGNSVIFKPSELTPITALKLAEIYKEAGLPDGVFNVLQGDGSTGKLLTAHPAIAKVSLTGSVPTGKHIMATAAQSLKHVTLELGGKSPLLVFEDANLENAISAALMANFFTQGEICSNGTRVFVHESLYDTFLQRLIKRTQALTIGDPQNPKTQIGALISKAHMEKVLSYIESGKQEGACLVVGGDRPKSADELIGGESFLKGNFLKPAIFVDCDDRMKIAQEEIFGPVMCLFKFMSEEEAIQRANNTPFGLAAAVFTQNLSRGHRVAAQLEAGTVWINNYNITPIEVPFGGYKQSGIGRENSLVTIEHYTQLKTVYVEMGNVESSL